MADLSPFLATTSRSLLLIDGVTGNGYRIDDGRGLYYGITPRPGGFYVAARNRLVSSPVPPEQERGEILALDEALRVTSSLAAPFAMRDLHQILLHEGTLWATCAFDNMVAVFDGQRWEQWFPRGAPAQLPADVNHFNSLSVIGGELCVVAHNLGASELLFFSLPERQPVGTVPLGRAAHNAWIQDGELMTCSSMEGCLLGERGARVETGGFPRGIAHIGAETYVGVSELVERSGRDFSSAAIRVFDPAWRPLRTLTLPGEGMVLDLLPVAPEIWQRATQAHAGREIALALDAA